MGIKTSREAAYWKIDYFAVNLDTPHCHFRMLGWETQQDRDDKKPPIMATDFYFEGVQFDFDLNAPLLPQFYAKAKTKEGWVQAMDVMDEEPEAK